MISHPAARERDRLRKARGRGNEAACEDHAEKSLRAAMLDIVDSEPADMRSFFETAGIGDMPAQALQTGELWPLFRAHYSTRGKIDDARFASDLARWPLIAHWVAELRAQAA